MSIRYKIDFSEVQSPLAEAVTKFGGQPLWLEEPRWPLSRALGRPMRFICQLQIPADLVANSSPRLAYVFMTDGDEYVEGTWEPEGGENAVVIQPRGGPLLVDTAPTAEGPTLYRMTRKAGASRLTPEPCEFSVILAEGDEPEYVSQERFLTFSEAQAREYSQALEGNKIAGMPMFIQNDEFPQGGPWKLLLQLDSTRVPFAVNFGDCGVAYVFLSVDGREGRLLWQCT